MKAETTATFGRLWTMMADTPAIFSRSWTMMAETQAIFGRSWTMIAETPAISSRSWTMIAETPAIFSRSWTMIAEKWVGRPSYLFLGLLPPYLFIKYNEWSSSKATLLKNAGLLYHQMVHRVNQLLR